MMQMGQDGWPDVVLRTCSGYEERTKTIGNQATKESATITHDGCFANLRASIFARCQFSYLNYTISETKSVRSKYCKDSHGIIIDRN